MKRMVPYIGLMLLVILLFFVFKMSAQPSVNYTGAILGWSNRLYKLESVIGPQQVGKQLSSVGYHGHISGSFVIRELVGSQSDQCVVFETYGIDGKPNGQYYKAVVIAQPKSTT